MFNQSCEINHTYIQPIRSITKNLRIRDEKSETKKFPSTILGFQKNLRRKKDFSSQNYKQIFFASN